MFNNPKTQNTFDDALIDRVIGLLDIVEKSEGPAILVTYATGNKIFSTGFNLSYW